MSTNAVTFIRIRALCRRLGGAGPSTVYDWLSESSPRHDPTMPRPVKIGANTVAWVEAEVDEWLDNKVASAKAAQRKSR